MDSKHSTENLFLGRVRICLELLHKQQIKNKRIVDVGATFGWLEKALEKDGEASVTGIEPNPAALQQAKQSAPNATLLPGDAANIPLTDNSADIVTLFDVIEHVPRHTESAVFREINRILIQGGQLLLSTPNAHPLVTILDPAWYFGHRHYTPQRIINLLRKNGFAVISCEVRGGIVCTVYLLWFYLAKWVFRSKKPDKNLLRTLDDASFDKKGIFEIFLVAEKR